jgi:hypothetical protein
MRSERGEVNRRQVSGSGSKNFKQRRICTNQAIASGKITKSTQHEHTTSSKGVIIPSFRHI